MPRCQAENRDGTRCRNSVLEGEQYCHLHAQQSQSQNEEPQSLEITIERLLKFRAVRVLIGLMLITAFLGAVLGSLAVLIAANALDVRRMAAEESRQAQRTATGIAYEATLTAVRTLPPVTTSLGKEVRTEEWAITISEVKRANWLLWNTRRLEPDGQWLILYGTARNITTQTGALFASNFELQVPSLSGGISVNRNATGAAGLQAGIENTVAGFMGITIKAGETAPLVLAFDLPSVAEEATLRLAGTRLAIDIGPVGQTPVLTPLPEETETPMPTDTPVPTDTPTLTATLKPTNTSAPSATPSRTRTPTRTGTPTPTRTATRTATPTSSPEIPAIVVARSLRVRAGPGTSFQLVGGLPQGAEITLVARNATGTWVRGRIPSTGLEGWFAAAFVEMEGDVMTLPVAEASRQGLPTLRPTPTTSIS